MRTPPRGIRILLVSLFLLAGCSGDRKPPKSPSPAPAENTSSTSAPRDAAVPAGEGVLPSSTAAVRNSPPEIRGVRFVPGDARTGAGLGVEADGYDADGDAVRFEIAWRRNGEPAGDGNRMEGPVKRGDRVVVTITPFDGKARGRGAELSREIRNTPPVIEGQEGFRVSDNLVTFRVQASDPDGDPILFALKDAPSGMRIGRSNGQVRWETARGTAGKIPFTVTVSDGSGGEATARFSVTITEEPVPGAGPR
jgi:hypothetical protein